MSAGNLRRDLRLDYDPLDDRDPEPYDAENTYTHVTITNAKNSKFKDTPECKTCVYTQDLYNQHEDRFLFDTCTQGNLAAIKDANPTHRWTMRIICPPSMTCVKAFMKLVENTLWRSSNAGEFVKFGASLSSDNDKKGKVRISHNSPEIDPIDLQFALCNYSQKVNLSLTDKYLQNGSNVFRFYQYGFEEQYKEYLTDQKALAKVRSYDYEGTLLDKVPRLHSYMLTADPTQPIYTVDYLWGLIKIALNHGIKYLELGVKVEGDNGWNAISDLLDHKDYSVTIDKGVLFLVSY